MGGGQLSECGRGASITREMAHRAKGRSLKAAYASLDWGRVPPALYFDLQGVVTRARTLICREGSRVGL